MRNGLKFFRNIESSVCLSIIFAAGHNKKNSNNNKNNNKYIIIYNIYRYFKSFFQSL